MLQEILNKSSAVVATANSRAVDIATARDLLAHLSVTLIDGTTPTLDIKFQESIDGFLWIDIPTAAFTQVEEATGSQRLELACRARYLRAVYTLGGTDPSYTFDLLVAGKT